MGKIGISGLVSTIAMLVAQPSVADLSFNGIGSLEGDTSQVRALSSNGMTVVGSSSDGVHDRAVLWSTASGLVALGNLGDGPSQASAVSSAGDVVVGRAFNGQVNEAFRWSENDGLSGLGGLSTEGSEALGVSADGTVVVGFDGLIGRSCRTNNATGESDCPPQLGTERAFVWRTATGMQQLPALPDAPLTRARSVNSDGSAIAGFSFSYAQLNRAIPPSTLLQLVTPAGSAVSWDADNTIVDLGSSPSFGESGIFGDVLAFTENDELVIASGGVASIGALDSARRLLPSNLAIAAVDADGVTLVGKSLSFRTAEAQRESLVHLKPLLMQHFGLDLTGWVLSEATAISADGLTFAGNGTNPLGQAEGWIAQLNEWPDAAELDAVPSMNAFDFASPLASAVLPASRSARVGEVVTAFVTMINTERQFAGIGCRPGLASDIPAVFDYHLTDPETNLTIGEQNTPVDIAADGGLQTFVIGITPTAPFDPADIVLSYDCANSIPARSLVGVNTLALSASTEPVADVITLATTANLQVPESSGAEFAEFAVAIANVGSGAELIASLDTASTSLPLNSMICPSDAVTGACVEAMSASTTLTVEANATATFRVSVNATGPIAFDPAMNRLFVRFRDTEGELRGATSLAVRTP